MRILATILLLLGFAQAQVLQPPNGGTGAPSILATDVSKFGVKGDGHVVDCVANAGNTTIACFNNANFTPADVGKLILLYGAGPPTGEVDLNGMTVVSGGSGAVPGTQPITFTDTTDGCNSYKTMPYGWVTVGANGVASGAVTRNPSFGGDGCTKPPTSGTVPGVGGTPVAITFTGGTMVAGDIPTTIQSVINSSTITVPVSDVPVVSTGGTVFVYGTDDHDAWQRACDAPGAASSAQYFTFRGTSLISHGITCNGAGFKLEGVGWGNLGSPNASILVYAGKGQPPPVSQTTGANHDWILELAEGGGAVVTRMGFKGNTMAKPYAIMPSFGRGFTPSLPGCSGSTDDPACYHGGVKPTSGDFVGQMNNYDYIWAGWGWGDANASNGYSIQSCILANGVIGNTDFNTVDHFYCYTSEVGFDSVNDQATVWHFGKIQSEANNIGFACTSGLSIDDFYTEFNRTDFEVGSPGFPGGICTYLTVGYGGESSSKSVEGSNLFNAFNAIVLNGSATLAYLNPSGYGFDLQHDDGGRYTVGSITLYGMDGKIRIPTDCGTTGNIDFSGIYPDQIVWSPNTDSNVCNNGIASSFRIHNVPWMSVDVNAMSGSQQQNGQLNSRATKNWFDTLFQQDFYYENTIGSILVTSPRSPGQTDVPPPGAGTYWIGAQKYENGVVCGNTIANPPQPPCTGTTPFRYQMTCVDGQGLESRPAYVPGGNVDNYTGVGWTHSLDANQNLIITVPSGTVPLSATNYILNAGQYQRGCSSYNLYGDEGSGAIGFLTSIRADRMDRQVLFYDEGQWTKQARIPPATSQSGSIEVENNFTIDSLKGLSCIGTDANGKFIPGTCGTGGGGGISSINGSSASAQTIVGANGINVNTTLPGKTTITGPTIPPPVTSLPLSSIKDPTADTNINLGTHALNFLTAPSPGTVGQISIQESAPSTTAGVMVLIQPAAGSQADPFAAVGPGGLTKPSGGMYVTAAGQVRVGFGGVLQLLEDGSSGTGPSMRSLSCLGTDGNGDVIPGTCGGGSSSGGTSPFTISNGINSLVFTVPTTGNPVISSTSGGINVASLFVTNLSGSGIRMLHADALGNVTRSTLISEDSGATTVGILGTGGLVADATVTGDTGMFAPVYNVCPTNPCSIVGPTSRVAGAVPLASIHLSDFSPNAPTAGQVPVWNAANFRYEPGTVTGGGGGAPLFPVVTPALAYTVTAADFAAARTLARGASTATYTLPSSAARPSTNGQVIKIINYGTGVTNVVPGTGTTINGSGATVTWTGNPSPQSAMVVFDGANYILERYSQNPVFSPSANQLAVFQPGTGTITSLGAGVLGQQLISAGPGVVPTWENPSAPSTSWSSLTNPTANLNLTMAGNATTITYNFPGSGLQGLRLLGSNSATGTPSELLSLQQNDTSNVIPLSVSLSPSGKGFFVVNGTGDIQMQYGSKLKGPVQLMINQTTPVANAPSLVTDANGNIVPGTSSGGGEVIVSFAAITGRTSGTTLSTWVPFGGTGTIANVATEPGGRAIMPLAGTIGICYAYAESNGVTIPASATWTWNLLKNGAACGSTVVINSTTGYIANGNVGCSFVAGNGLSWRIDSAGSPPNSFHSISCVRQ